MRYLKTILVFCLLALTLAGCAGSTLGNGYFPADGNYGPATSVPQTYMTPNGDRVSHYAPYFFPDGTSGGERR
jgi:hypothetical protein